MLTIAARLELFKKQFPHEKIRSTQEREGTNYSVLEINHTWMCKSAKTPEGLVLLEREVQLLTLLQGKITTAIPVPLHYEDNFFVYKKIPGSPLISYAYYRLGNKQRSKLLFDIAQFLKQLHTALTPQDISSLKLTSTDLPWSIEKLHAHRHHLNENKDMAEVFDSIMKMYEEHQTEPFQPVLIHNDMEIKNIIIDPLTGQLRGIIGFTKVAFDDPAYDLCMRHGNPIDYVKALSLVYGMIDNSPQNSQKIYGYYFATEFSRYFQYIEHGQTQQAQATFNEIVKTIREFLTSHDDCNENGGTCSHDEQETPATT